MHKIKIKLLTCHTHAGVTYRAGEILEVSEADAQFICRLNIGEKAYADKAGKQTRGEQ